MAAAMVLVACEDEPRWKTGEGGSFGGSLCALAAPGLMPESRCTATGAPSTLALGVCGAVSTSASLRVEAPNRDAYVAVNGACALGGETAVDGSLTAFESIDSRATQQVSGAVMTNGRWQVAQSATVSGDAYVGGVVEGAPQVTGTLFINDESAAGGALAGSVRVQAVNVERPLDCSMAPRASALAEEARTTRKGWADEVFPADSLSLVSKPSTLSLGCGRYYFTGADLQAPTRIAVEGTVVVVIDGDLHVGAPVSFELSDGATLDLVVGGSLLVDDQLDVGVDDDPHAVWVAVGGAMRVGATTRISGSVVMPDGTLTVEQPFELRGNALVGALEVNAPMVLHDGYAMANDGCVAPR